MIRCDGGVFICRALRPTVRQSVTIFLAATRVVNHYTGGEGPNGVVYWTLMWSSRRSGVKTAKRLGLGGRSAAQEFAAPGLGEHRAIAPHDLAA